MCQANFLQLYFCHCFWNKYTAFLLDVIIDSCLHSSVVITTCIWVHSVPDSKVHGANMGPTWVLSAPGVPHVGPMDLAIWGIQCSAPYPHMEYLMCVLCNHIITINHAITGQNWTSTSSVLPNLGWYWFWFIMTCLQGWWLLQSCWFVQQIKKNNNCPWYWRMNEYKIVPKSISFGLST